MKSFKLFLTVLFLAVLGLSNVWGADTWNLCSITDLTSTDVFVIVDANTGKAMTNNNGTSSAPAATAVTVSEDGNSITGVTDAMKWNISGNASGYIFYPNGDNEKWLYATATNNGLRVGTNDNKTFVIENHTNGEPFLKHSGTSRYIGVYNSSDWRCYTSVNTNIQDTKVRFYKVSGDSEQPTLQSIAISGTPTKTTYEAGDAFDPAGLVVTGTYSEGDPEAITEGITWEVTPETLTEGLTSVSVTATVSGVSSTAHTVNGLTVNPAAPTASFIFNTDAGLSALGITKPASSAGTNLGDAAYASGDITMTATNGSTETRVWNSSGTTSLRVYAKNGSNGTITFTGATITKIVFTGTVSMTANVGTFSEKTWTGSATSVTFTATSGVTISTIAVSYVAGSAAETVATPVLPAAGAFVGSKSIELSCETEGASIYYTLDGNDPTTASTLYNGAFTLTETATVKAIGVKDGMTNSNVASATYTKVVTLNSMEEIFAAATTAGSTATSKVITFNNWVISGVKGSNAYLTDNNGKGLIIYQSGHGFEVGDILSGTATCKVQLYRASAELTELTSSALTVNKGGSVTPITSASIADLSGVNTGAVYSFSNLTYNGSAFSDGENTITPYSTFITTLPTLINDKEYNVKGMYLQFNDTKEILPFVADDIELVSSITLSSVVISGTVTKNEYFVGDAFDKAGLTVTATYSDASTLDVTSSAEWSFDPAALNNTSITTVNVTATFNEVSSEAYPVAVTVSPAPLKVTWDLSTDETASASADALSWTSDYATMGVAKGESTTATNNYYPGTSGKTYTSTRFYTKSVLTIAPVDGYIIDKVEFNATSTSFANAFQGCTWANASAAVSSTLVTVTPTDGEAAISATIGGNCGFTSAVVYYHVGPTKYNVVNNLTGCSADEENAKKFVDGTDNLTLSYALTEGYVWPENISVKVAETVLSAEQYTWSTENAAGTLVIAYEMHDNLTITIKATEKVVASIAVKTAPTKVEYFAGDNFDPAGLVITATYNDASTTDIAYAYAAADFSFAPALDAALALDDENVVITYHEKNCNQAISVTVAPLHADWVASAQGYENGDAVTTSDIKKADETVATITFDKGTSETNSPKYYTTGTGVRTYGGNTFTVATLKGNVALTKVVLSFGSGDGSNEITIDAGAYANGTWTGSASSVTFTIAGTTGHRRIAGITVYYETLPMSSIRTGLTADDFGTMCQANDILYAEGAIFFEIEKKNAIGLDLVEAEFPLVAGKPYLYQATDAEVNVVFGNEVATEVVEANGLVGRLNTATGVEYVPTDMYVIQKNALRKVATGDIKFLADRAYINYDAVTDQAVEDDPMAAPRRRVTMGGVSADVVTSMDEIATEQGAVKFIENGVLYILRDGKRYNAQGQLVK